MERAMAGVRSDLSVLTPPLTYYVIQGKSLNLSRPYFIFKMKLCPCTQTAFVIPGGRKNIFLFFRTMLYIFSILFRSSFTLLLLHFDVKIGKAYDNLDSLGLLDSLKGEESLKVL